MVVEGFWGWVGGRQVEDGGEGVEKMGGASGHGDGEVDWGFGEGVSDLHAVDDCGGGGAGDQEGVSGHLGGLSTCVIYRGISGSLL